MRSFTHAVLRRDFDGGLYCRECWEEEYGPSEQPDPECSDSKAAASVTQMASAGESMSLGTRSNSGTKATAAEGVAVLSATMPTGASLLGPFVPGASLLSSTMPSSSALSDMNLSLSSSASRSADSSVHFGSSDDEIDLLPQSGRSHRTTSSAPSSECGGAEIIAAVSPTVVPPAPIAGPEASAVPVSSTSLPPLAKAGPKAPLPPLVVAGPKKAPAAAEVPVPVPVPGPTQLSRDPADYVFSKRRSERLVRTQGRIGAQQFVIEELVDCEVLLLDVSGQVCAAFPAIAVPCRPPR